MLPEEGFEPSSPLSKHADATHGGIHSRLRHSGRAFVPYIFRKRAKTASPADIKILLDTGTKIALMYTARSNPNAIHHSSTIFKGMPIQMAFFQDRIPGLAGFSGIETYNREGDKEGTSKGTKAPS